MHWWRQLRSAARRRLPLPADATPPPVHSVSGKYQSLHKYLAERYADRIFLTFAEVEDVLGSKLPGEARHDGAWWTQGAGDGPSDHADAWRLASRIAIPNVPAQMVVFERRL